MQDASGITVTVYFVVRGKECDLITGDVTKAAQFIETFNRLRTPSMAVAEMQQRVVTL